MRYKGYCVARYNVYFDGMAKPSTFEELLAMWETPKALSADLGVPYVNAQLMKRRKSVGVDHWPRLIEAVGAKGLRLTTDDLLAMRAASKSEAA